MSWGRWLDLALRKLCSGLPYLRLRVQVGCTDSEVCLVQRISASPFISPGLRFPILTMKG